jgi:hypothetical protein
MVLITAESKPPSIGRIVLRFASKKDFKRHLQGASKEAKSSMHFKAFADEHNIDFFIPMRQYHNSEKLWVGYDGVTKEIILHT